MIFWLSSVYIIALSSSIIGSLITIFIVLKNRKKYGIRLIPIFNLFLIISIGIIFPILFFFSIALYFSPLINSTLFIFVVIVESVSLWLYSIDMSLLKEYGRIPILIFLIFALLFSVLIGLLISISNIEAIVHRAGLLYTLNGLTKFIAILFNSSVLIYLIYNSIKIFSMSAFQKLSSEVLLFSTLLSFSISFFCFFLFFENMALLHMFNFFFYYTLLLKCLLIIKNPKIYVKLTNRIYYIHIYHKSGVLLYSYNFSSRQEESMIWGNILIGLNHILSEFVNKEEQIDVLQTENAEIVVDYNNASGFAVLLITNQRNSYIEHCMNRFMKEFEEKYRSELKEIEDINKIINVTDFEDAKYLIEQNFKIYL
jgi:hypothetical protein